MSQHKAYPRLCAKSLRTMVRRREAEYSRCLFINGNVREEPRVAVQVNAQDHVHSDI